MKKQFCENIKINYYINNKIQLNLGSGKTTLLNFLAGRLFNKNLFVEGILKLNN